MAVYTARFARLLNWSGLPGKPSGGGMSEELAAIRGMPDKVSQNVKIRVFAFMEKSTRNIWTQIEAPNKHHSYSRIEMKYVIRHMCYYTCVAKIKKN